jgi:hypothetical protein
VWRSASACLVLSTCMMQSKNYLLWGSTHCVWSCSTSCWQGPCACTPWAFASPVCSPLILCQRLSPTLDFHYDFLIQVLLEFRNSKTPNHVQEAATKIWRPHLLVHHQSWMTRESNTYDSLRNIKILICKL